MQATAIAQTTPPPQKGIQMHQLGKIPIIPPAHIPNAHPAARHTTTAIVRNADTPTSIRDGWERSIRNFIQGVSVIGTWDMSNLNYK